MLGLNAMAYKKIDDLNSWMNKEVMYEIYE